MARIATTCVLIAFCGAGGLPGGDGLWLCVGADGHVGLKGPVDTPCHAGMGEHEEHAVGIQPAGDEQARPNPCGPCVDIPLKTFVGTSPVRPRGSGAPNTLVCCAGAVAPEPATGTLLPGPVRLCPPAAALRDHRFRETIVLQI
ncbi:MAG TPA: hypothetical protein VM695_07965 [Phycisphaerae bacterium]|nr:hypothetical protein [Phycisphaerae bacterium]